MKPLNNPIVDELLKNALKKKDFAEDFSIGLAIGFVHGVNDFANKIAPLASKLLRNGSPEGGEIMNMIKGARKLIK